jgi:hypothetical protein
VGGFGLCNPNKPAINNWEGTVQLNLGNNGSFRLTIFMEFLSDFCLSTKTDIYKCSSPKICETCWIKQNYFLAYLWGSSENSLHRINVIDKYLMPKRGQWDMMSFSDSSWPDKQTGRHVIL